MNMNVVPQMIATAVHAIQAAENVEQRALPHP